MNDFLPKPFDLEKIYMSLIRVKEKSSTNNEINVQSKSPEDDIKINKLKILNHFSNDLDVFKNYLSLFKSHSPNMLTSIKTAIEKNNPKDLEIYAHKLKGSVSNFHANDIIIDLSDLEKMGKNNVIDKAWPLFLNIKTKIDYLIVELNKLI